LEKGCPGSLPNRDAIGDVTTAGRKTADAATDRALAAEGRTAHADAEASTAFTLAHGIELEAFRGWTRQTTHEVSLQPGMPNVRRKGRPACGTSP
jgi:hypothetical protein